MIPATLRACCDELRAMVAQGIRPTAHEMLTLATRLEQAAERLDDTEVFSPVRDGVAFRTGRVVDLRRAFAVIEGGRE